MKNVENWATLHESVPITAPIFTTLEHYLMELCVNHLYRISRKYDRRFSCWYSSQQDVRTWSSHKALSVISYRTPQNWQLITILDSSCSQQFPVWGPLFNVKPHMMVRTCSAEWGNAYDNDKKPLWTPQRLWIDLYLWITSAYTDMWITVLHTRARHYLLNLQDVCFLIYYTESFNVMADAVSATFRDQYVWQPFEVSTLRLVPHLTCEFEYAGPLQWLRGPSWVCGTKYELRYAVSWPYPGHALCADIVRPVLPIIETTWLPHIQRSSKQRLIWRLTCADVFRRTGQDNKMYSFEVSPLDSVCGGGGDEQTERSSS
jgi:hypothetical protein